MILKDAEPFEAYDCKTGGCCYEGDAFHAYVNGMQHVLEDLDSAPEIDPESLPVVKQLRAELERLKEGPAFNVGDSVWQTDGIDVYELEVKRLIYDCEYIAFDASAIGKRIFKTSSEAEAAMAKAKEAPNG